MPRLLRLEAVMDITALSRSKIYELLAKDQFPRPVKLPGARLNAWADSEIARWIEQRLAERDCP